MIRAILVSSLLLLSACSTYADRQGRVWSELWPGIPLWSESAAPPAHADDTPPWETPGWTQLTDEGRVEVARAWNRDRGFVPTPAPATPFGLPWWAYPLLMAAARAGQTVFTRSGKSNYRVVFDPETTWRATGSAVLHNLIGTSSPPEALPALPDADKAKTPVGFSRSGGADGTVG